MILIIRWQIPFKNHNVIMILVIWRKSERSFKLWNTNICDSIHLYEYNFIFPIDKKKFMYNVQIVRNRNLQYQDPAAYDVKIFHIFGALCSLLFLVFLCTLTYVVIVGEFFSAEEFMSHNCMLSFNSGWKLIHSIYD